MNLLDKAKELLALLLEAVRMLGRSILGTSRSSTTACSEPRNKMEIVAGYWDPRNLCFIEESALDQLELCSVGADARAARRRSLDEASSASTPENGDASDRIKKC